MKVLPDGKIDARSLYKRLGVGSQFGTWFQRRLGEGCFEEGVDYERYDPGAPCDPRGGRPAVQYALTVDMVIKVCLLERTAKGAEARAEALGMTEFYVHTTVTRKALGKPSTNRMDAAIARADKRRREALSEARRVYDATMCRGGVRRDLVRRQALAVREAARVAAEEAYEVAVAEASGVWLDAMKYLVDIPCQP